MFIEYNYSFSQYYRFITSGEGSCVHINNLKMDAIMDYTTSLDLVMKGLAQRDSDPIHR
jgi:hypothetical protein